jgi:hypothetical protein
MVTCLPSGMVTTVGIGCGLLQPIPITSRVRTGRYFIVSPNELLKIGRAPVNRTQNLGLIRTALSPFELVPQRVITELFYH